MSETVIHSNPDQAPGRPAPPPGWDQLERALSAALGVLQEESLVVSARTGNRYVQFSVGSAFGLHAESVSNAYLEEDERLDGGQVAALAALGWSPPARTPEQEEAGQEPRGSPNFHREFPSPVPFEAVARLAVRTLAEVLRVPGPGDLQYTAFDRAGHAIVLPTLRLERTPPRPPSLDPERPPRPHAAFGRLRQRVLAAVRRLAGDSTLELDGDGDVILPLGRRTAVVKAIERPLVVRVYTELASAVEASDALVCRLHELNTRLSLARLVLANGSVFAAIDLPAAPFHSAHLEAARSFLARAADGLAREIREAGAASRSPAGARAVLN
jgi:hypothetical protein